MKTYRITLDLEVPGTWNGTRALRWIGAALYRYSKGNVKIPAQIEVREKIEAARPEVAESEN